MAVFCERTAADPGLLARPDVQKLTPYQSARRTPFLSFPRYGQFAYFYPIHRNTQHNVNDTRVFSCLQHYWKHSMQFIFFIHEFYSPSESDLLLFGIVFLPGPYR